MKTLSESEYVFRELNRETIARFGVFCRLFLADDPKAELAKMIMEMSNFLDPLKFKVYENPTLDLLYKTRSELHDQDRLAVSTFLANFQVSSENQTN